MSAAVLEVRGLAKSFGGVQAVAGVDLSMPRGEIRALIGPNGAGKTTFFNMLTGQLKADTGEVTVDRGGETSDFQAADAVCG